MTDNLSRSCELIYDFLLLSEATYIGTHTTRKSAGKMTGNCQRISGAA